MSQTATPAAQRPTSPARVDYQDQGADQPLPDLATYIKTYAKQNPDVTAYCCFGVGFILGWKLKPW